MPLSHDELRSIPLLAALTDDQLDAFCAIFERLELTAGERLCAAGDPARELYILARGEVTLSDGDRVSFALRPPAQIGELGALGNLQRNVTVTVTRDAEVWRASRSAVLELMRARPDLGLALYQSLVEVCADKISRDQLRLADMRGNLIRTQKSMKALREFVLENEDTPVSARVHDELEALIDHNRKINYRVDPPDKLPASVRIAGAAREVTQLSRTHITARGTEAAGARVTGVLSVAGTELPVSGVVERAEDGCVTVALDPLIDDYAAVLEGYLSRVQMVDFVV